MKGCEKKKVHPPKYEIKKRYEGKNYFLFE